MPLHDRFDELRRRNEAAELAGGAERIARQHKAGKKTARERIELLVDKGSFNEMDRLVVHQSVDFGMEDQHIPGDGVVTGSGAHPRAAGVRVRAGLHGLRRLAVGGLRAEDLQDHGPGHEGGRAHHRPQRLGRRAHPGGRGLAGRLRRHLPAQHPGLGRGAADLGHHGALRGRRGLLAGHHRLRVHGQEQLLHVRHRARRDPDGDPRGGLVRGAGRRLHPRRHLGRGPLRGGERGRVPRPHPRAADLPAPEQRRGSAHARRRSIRRTGWTRSSRRVVPEQPNQPYDIKDIVRPVLDDRYFFEVQADFAPNIVIGFGRLGRPAGGDRGQPARAPGRLPRHQRLGQGRALRALLRLLQHPDRDVRGRARLPARAPRRSSAASSSTGPSCSTPSARPRCRSSP